LGTAVYHPGLGSQDHGLSCKRRVRLVVAISILTRVIGKTGSQEDKLGTTSFDGGPVSTNQNRGLVDLKELIEAGKFAPAIDRTYRLSEVPEALRYFGEVQHKGKVVVAIGG
jgi:NADPH:quinone reductase-like Zn-dependent oxidoreductase